MFMKFPSLAFSAVRLLSH